jgi:hypothetical protein
VAVARHAHPRAGVPLPGNLPQLARAQRLAGQLCAAADLLEMTLADSPVPEEVLARVAGRLPCVILLAGRLLAEVEGAAELPREPEAGRGRRRAGGNAPGQAWRKGPRVDQVPDPGDFGDD